MKNEKIEYRCETKEEQAIAWNVGEENLKKNYDKQIQEFSQYREERLDKENFYYTINICNMKMKDMLRYKMYDGAKYAAETGIYLLEKYPKYADDYTDLFYEFDWCLNEKENLEYVKSILTSQEKNILNNKKKTIHTYILSTISALQCGYLEKAREFIRNAYEIKPRSRLDENVIYHLERFYAFIAEYLCEPEKNKDMLPKLTKCFKFLFDEQQKGSYKLFDKYVIDLTLYWEVFMLRYMWYKYFSGRDWDTVTFAEILQSERYGIKGLQD